MKQSISSADLSHIIGQIYDCVIDPDRWDVTLETIRTALGACNTQLTLFDVKTGQMLISRNLGIAPEWLERQSHYMAEVFEELILAPAIQDIPVAVISRDARPELIANSPFLTEWAHPQGIMDSLGMTLIYTENRVASLGAGRHESQGFYGPAEIEIAELLFPHIRRALTISDLLDVATVKTDLVTGAMDRFSAGIAIVDSHSRILHANAAARDMMQGDGLLQTERGILSAVGPAARSALKSSIAACSHGEATLPGAGRGIRLQEPDGRTAVAHVLPLSGGLRRAEVPGGAAAVFVNRQPSPSGNPAEILMSVFDLTKAELRVLNELMRGLDPAVVSTELGLAESTVRTHIRALFDKTDTRRLSALVALAGSLAVPLRGHDAGKG